MILSAANNHLECVKELLKQGADPSARRLVCCTENWSTNYELKGSLIKSSSLSCNGGEKDQYLKFLGVIKKLVLNCFFQIYDCVTDRYLCFVLCRSRRIFGHCPCIVGQWSLAGFGKLCKFTLNCRIKLFLIDSGVQELC